MSSVNISTVAKQKGEVFIKDSTLTLEIVIPMYVLETE